MLRMILCLILTFCLTPALCQNTSAAYQQKDKPTAKTPVVYICPMHPEERSATPGNCPKCEMKLVVEETQKQQVEQKPASTESVVYVCPMHPEIQSSTPGECPKCEMKLIVEESKKEEEIPEGAQEYTCPMHPEIRAGKPGKCPKCEMKLMPANPGIIDEFDLQFETSPPAPRTNEKVKFRFVVSNPKTGELVKQFAELHDKFFHLFVVSQDMSDFQHIHPKMEKDGSFTIETVLKQAGNYKIYSDIYPIEGAPQVIQRDLVTAGFKSDLFAAVPRLDPDPVLAKTVEGMKVSAEDADNAGVDLDLLPSGDFGSMKIELKLDPEEVIAGKFVALKYHLTDAKTGEPVRDLVPYLGAWGHTLILSQDQTDYVHSHPEETVPDTPDRSKVRGGPNVTFDALIPRPGVYRIWTQFLRGNRLATVIFTVRAERLR